MGAQGPGVLPAQPVVLIPGDRQGRRCAVLGSPVRHSLSPVLHREAYAELGLDWTYTAVELTEAGLAGYVGALDASWRGLSVTMPLKRRAAELADELDPWAARSGVANTLLLADGRVRGLNTDIPGAVAAITAALGPRPPVVGRAAVLGGGATAASMLLALGELGVATVTVRVRDPARATAGLAAVLAAGLADGALPEVSIEPLDAGPPDSVDLVVSTLPEGALAEEQVALWSGSPVVFDASYHPWPTRLAVAAGDAGATVVTGLDLLVHQAVLQVEAMTGGGRPDVTALTRAGLAALEEG